MTAQYDGHSLARLLEEPEPLDATDWHLVPIENRYAIYRRKEGVLFFVLHHGEESREALIKYLLENGATVGPKPEQDKEALAAWTAKAQSRSKL